MTEETFQILRSAVTIARNEQIRRLSTLREKLAQKFPGQDEQIREALAAWAKYEAGKIEQ